MNEAVDLFEGLGFIQRGCLWNSNDCQ